MSDWRRPDESNVEDRIAWALCQILDDDAPLQWARYRAAATIIVMNDALMADLQTLRAEKSRGR